jgi:hypothetical protein
LRTVLRSIPLCRAIVDTDRPCRCKSSIIIISPILITETPLPTIRRSIGDHAPPVSRSALRKTGGSAKLGKIQTALLGSIEPASTRAVEIGGLNCKSIASLIANHKAARHSTEPTAIVDHANLRGPDYFH